MRTIAPPTAIMLYNGVFSLPAASSPAGSHPSGCRHTAPRSCPSGFACRSGVPSALDLVPPRVFVTQDRFDNLLVLRHSRCTHGRVFTLGDSVYNFDRAPLKGGRDPVHPCVAESCRCRCVAYRWHLVLYA